MKTQYYSSTIYKAKTRNLLFPHCFKIQNEIFFTKQSKHAIKKYTIDEESWFNESKETKTKKRRITSRGSELKKKNPNKPVV